MASSVRFGQVVSSRLLQDCTMDLDVVDLVIISTEVNALWRGKSILDY